VHAEIPRHTGDLDDAAVLGLLNKALDEQSYAVEDTSDFAVLGTDNEIFMALYSVGSLGVQWDGTGPYIFCHDGA
jgi:hypothetical protein